MSFEHSLLHFEFSDFKSHPTDLRSAIDADNICRDCRGNDIRAKLNFRDYENDNEDRWLSFAVKSDSTSVVQISFIIKNAEGKVHHEDASCIGIFKTYNSSDTLIWNFQNIQFIRYSEVVDRTNKILSRQGALNFYVDLQFKPEPKELYKPFNPLEKNLLSLLDNGSDADVKFSVQGEEILAHKLILKAGSPILSSICEGADKETAIEIEGIDPRAFKMVLRHIYGQTTFTLTKSELLAHWKDIINIADRYSVESLKMVMECVVINNCIIDTKNVADYILFADAKNCPSLKEYAVSYFMARAQDIIDTPHAEKLEESAELMKELLVDVLKKSDFSKPQDGGMAVDTLRKMTVNELRKKLATIGLEVDGSKEVLTSRLEEFESNKRQRTTIDLTRI